MSAKRASAAEPRPLRRAEFEIVLATRQAQEGWRDLFGTTRNQMVDAWDRLCTEPMREDGERVYCLKGDLGTGTHAGTAYTRYQYKLPGGARLWYFVDTSLPKDAKVAGRVLVEQVHTRHPKPTDE